MQITGTLVEIGRLEEESGADGIGVRLDDDSLVTLKGLHVDDIRPLATLYLERVTITVAAAK
jgi:hypothetical protein